MSFSNSLTELLNIRFPIMQAPIGSCSCPELAAAVSNAGGLGMMALSWDSLENCRRKIASTLLLTKAPFGINLVLEWDQTERLQTCIDAGAPIVSLFWGDAKPYLPRIHGAGAKAIVTAGNAEEAKRAADLGGDVVLCQGFEAGGHVWGKVGSVALVPTVVDAVHPVPVIAAGGFGDGRGLVAALGLGASGICMGTRFVATEESRAHQLFKERILQARPQDAVYTYLFDGGWPNAPHRVLINSTLENWQKSGQRPHGARPGEGEVIGSFKNGKSVYRYDDMPPIQGMEGNWEACALYAGQSVGVVHTIKPAGTVVQEVIKEATQIIQGLAALAL